MNALRPDVRARVEALARAVLTRHAPTHVVTLAMPGFCEALATAAQQQRIPTTLVLPFIGHELVWGADARTRMQALITRATSTVVVGTRADAPAALFRAGGRHVLAHTDRCLTLEDGRDPLLAALLATADPAHLLPLWAFWEKHAGPPITAPVRREPCLAMLHALRARGVTAVARVASVPDGGRQFIQLRRGVLTLAACLLEAPPSVLAALATLLEGEGTRLGKTEASAVVRAHARLAFDEARAAVPPTPCLGTTAQQQWLRAAYLHLNTERFAGQLPAAIHLRWGRRMANTLGHCMYGQRDGQPVIKEIALNLDLALPGNEAQLRDTLLHEMAHAAAFLVDGHRGHGVVWKRWARQVGCQPTACTSAPIQRPVVKGERAYDAPVPLAGVARHHGNGPR